MSCQQVTIYFSQVGVGADVIPLGFGEIVSSLQTGLIEAGENAVSLYARTGISDESPHFSLTKHASGCP